MPWSVTSSPEGKIIDVGFSGVVGIADFAQAYDQVTLLANSTGFTRVVMDLSAVQENQASVAEIFFEVARRRTDTGSHVALRRAVILPQSPELAEKAHFFATASINSAFQLKEFRDRQSALAWLTES
ncbi:MAG: hypothetical protein JSR48_08550 [Verrucomicrobia bacterium]|nr:hypothetical protein [Verrucomicrobiota bacterium]